MAEETTTIHAVVRGQEGRDALVEVEQSGCGRCHEEGGCGGQHLTQMFCSNAKTYRVENTVGASVGERVTVAIAAGSVRQTANLAYGLPLLGLLLGAFFGMAIAGDAGAMLGAAAGLFLSFFYVRLRVRREAGNPAGRPYIVSRS